MLVPPWGPARRISSRTRRSRSKSLVSGCNNFAPSLKVNTPTLVVSGLSCTRRRRAAATSAASMEFRKLRTGGLPTLMPPMVICGVGNPENPELSGSSPASPKSLPAYCAVLPETSTTKNTSTLADRPASRATLPLTKIKFCSWVIRPPSLGERICTRGSAANAELRIAPKRRNHGTKNRYNSWFMATHIDVCWANMIYGDSVSSLPLHPSSFRQVTD